MGRDGTRIWGSVVTHYCSLSWLVVEAVVKSQLDQPAPSVNRLGLTWLMHVTDLRLLAEPWQH